MKVQKEEERKGERGKGKIERGKGKMENRKGKTERGKGKRNHLFFEGMVVASQGATEWSKGFQGFSVQGQ